jgi:tetratricopeptide (TPR) repeat protein/tRNA A-37 threonylcarbamoyl transferase component Bud32
MARPDDPRSSPGDPAATDVFGETMAPTTGAPTLRAPTGPVAAGSDDALRPPSTPRAAPGSASDELWAGATIDATHSGAAIAITPLPLVDSGMYVAEREVARGGMGRIIAARDTRLHRPVALKELLAQGPEQAERFRREALITARLQHPAIVPVYEAGRWPTGEPFFAMKLVAGRPLDKVIGERGTLDLRLELLPAIIAATDAIAYAHSQRVIHRDLKPSNVLVGDFGETVVIDWGLAKDLDADDSLPPAVRDPAAPRADADRPDDSRNLTMIGAVMGTPAYMPPEQARGEAVDERADVFSLGAMLYHLLAGAPPYQARTATEVVEAAMTNKVIPLRQRAKNAAPDLLAIVERAMARDPADRYPNARELAEELRRFQTGQLVATHHYSAAQRIRRLVRKHRAAVAIGSGALVVIAIGGALAIRSIVTERDAAMAARQVAETRRAAAEQLVDYMVSDLRGRLAPIGRLDLLAGIGDGVRSYYDALAGLELAPADIDREAEALDILGLAQQSRGELDQALATWQREAQALDDELVRRPDDPGTGARRRRRADADLAIGAIHQARGQTDAAVASYDAAIAAYDRLFEDAPDDAQVALGVAAAHDRLGELHRAHGRIDLALAQHRQALAARERAATHLRGDRGVVYALSESHYRLGLAYAGAGASKQTLEELRTATRLRASLVDADPENTTWQAGLAQVEVELADFQRQIGELDESVNTYRATLPILEALVRRDPSNTSWRRDRGNLLSDLGFALVDEGDPAHALERFAQAIANHTDLLTVAPDNASWQIDLSRMHTRAGDAYRNQGDLTSALAAYDRGRAIRDGLLARDRKNAVWRRTAAWSYHKIAGVLAIRGGKGDLAAAIAAQEQALAIRADLARASTDHAGLQDELALSQVILGDLYVQAGTVDRGLALLDAGILAQQALVDSDPVNGQWKQALVRGLIARGRAERVGGQVLKARADLERAVAAAAAAATKAPGNAEWQAQLALAHWGLALAMRAGPVTAPKRAAAETATARELFAQLAKSGRLAAELKPVAAEVARGPL